MKLSRTQQLLRCD